MTSYLALVPKYLQAHSRKTRLAIASVAIAVALITGIFSMLDVFLKFEKIQVIHDFGNYHMSVENPSPAEIEAISKRLDVERTGRWFGLKDGTVKGLTSGFGAIDESFAANMNLRMVEGRFPAKPNEIMIEQWAADDLFINAAVNDKVRASVPGLAEGEFIVSGLFNDISGRKASGTPGILLSAAAAEAISDEDKRARLLIQFKDGVNVNRAADEIAGSLGIEADRIGFNTRLLAVTGQSDNRAVFGLYATGAVLFCIVLVAGVVMIYNIFNLSVMDRVRQFGLLRCIGASAAQIRKLVRREGMRIALKAIPIGVAAGMLMTWICSAILKFYNDELFAGIPLFSVSPTGIAAGVVIGLATVYIASLLPANKAARVSPVNAVTGSGEFKPRKRHKRGLLTRLFRAELALGLNQAVMRKKTLVLMASSIAISIVLFLGFQVFVDFLHSSIKTTKPYTPDITLTAKEGKLGEELHGQLEALDGTKHVYGRMMGYVEASFDAAKLPPGYRDSRQLEIKQDGRFIPQEPAWLISYDQLQMNWAKDELIDGTLSESQMNEKNGVIAVAFNNSSHVSTEGASLEVGDEIQIESPQGSTTLKVMGVLRTVPFSSSQPLTATFITTEKQFRELTGQTGYDVLNIQLAGRNDDETVESIKQFVSPSIEFLDSRQQNAENDQTFLTMAVFIYGFVAVVGLISVLNIINTMNTSVAQKTRYFGVMRAVGMSGSQLGRMVVTEAAAYSLSGVIAGIALGLLLQKVLITSVLADLRLAWHFPYVQVALIVLIIMAVTMLSVVSPLKRIKKMSVAEVVHSL